MHRHRTKIIGALCAIVIGLLTISISTSALPTASAAEQQVATPTASEVFIDKQVISIQGYTIKGNNYFKLRDLAQYLNGTSKQFSVGWNGKSSTIELTSGSPYSEDKSSTSSSAKEGKQTAVVSKASIIINKQPVHLTAYTINGNTYFKLRDLGEKLKFPVIYRPADKSIQIMTAEEVKIELFSNLELNLRTNDYHYGNWRSMNNRALFQADHRLYILEKIRNENELHITEVANRNNKVVVKTELTDFGGFHAGEDGNYYVIYGQGNMEESDTKPVYRIVKYDKNWRKVAALDVADVYVSSPFNAGNVSMDSTSDKLAIHMTRQRYLTPDDGKRHQSNITLVIDTNNMTLISKSDIFPKNHVSHSFATYVRFNGDHIVYVDHGDAYPRSHTLQVEPLSNYVIEEDHEDYYYLKIHEYAFAKALGGNTGDNYTGLYLGGFEVGKSNYVVASTFSKQYMTTPNSQNVRIDYVNRDYSYDFSGHTLWLTNYESKDNVGIKQVHIVKIDEQTFVILWNEERGNDIPNTLMYAIVNDSGVILQQPKELLGIPASGGMDPLVDGRNIIWYSYNFDSRKLTSNPVELYTLTIPEFDNKVNEQKFSYIDPKEDRSQAIIRELEQRGYTAETYFDEKDNSGSYSFWDSHTYRAWSFMIYGDLQRISTGYAANSSHTFSNEVNVIAEELDVMKTVLETDLQIQMSDFKDQIISKVAEQYKSLKLMEDVVEFELTYNGVTLKAKYYLFYYLSPDEPLYSLSIDYYVEALKQKYSR